MTPEVFAEWLRRQGHRVVRTRSPYWFDAGPRGFVEVPERSSKRLIYFRLNLNAPGWQDDRSVPGQVKSTRPVSVTPMTPG